MIDPTYQSVRVFAPRFRGVLRRVAVTAVTAPGAVLLPGSPPVGLLCSFAATGPNKASKESTTRKERGPRLQRAVRLLPYLCAVEFHRCEVNEDGLEISAHFGSSASD